MLPPTTHAPASFHSRVDAVARSLTERTLARVSVDIPDRLAGQLSLPVQDALVDIIGHTLEAIAFHDPVHTITVRLHLPIESGTAGLTLTISDFGPGPTLKAALHPAGFAAIHARARAVGSTASLLGLPQGMASLVVRVPISALCTPLGVTATDSPNATPRTPKAEDGWAGLLAVLIGLTGWTSGYLFTEAGTGLWYLASAGLVALAVATLVTWLKAHTTAPTGEMSLAAREVRTAYLHRARLSNALVIAAGSLIGVTAFIFQQSAHVVTPAVLASAGIFGGLCGALAYRHTGAARRYEAVAAPRTLYAEYHWLKKTGWNIWLLGPFTVMYGCITLMMLSEIGPSLMSGLPLPQSGTSAWLWTVLLGGQWLRYAMLRRIRARLKAAGFPV